MLGCSACTCWAALACGSEALRKQWVCECVYRKAFGKTREVQSCHSERNCATLEREGLVESWQPVRRYLQGSGESQSLSTVLKNRELSLLNFGFKVDIGVWCSFPPINVEKASRTHLEIRKLPAAVLKLKLARRALGMLEMGLWWAPCFNSAGGLSHGKARRIKYQGY